MADSFPDETGKHCLNKVEIGLLYWLITALMFKAFRPYNSLWFRYTALKGDESKADLRDSGKLKEK